MGANAGIEGVIPIDVAVNFRNLTVRAMHDHDCICCYTGFNRDRFVSGGDKPVGIAFIVWIGDFFVDWVRETNEFVLNNT